MGTNSNDSERRPPQTQQQQDLVGQSEEHEDHCLEENQRYHQDFEQKTRDQEVEVHLGSNLLSVSLDKMPPHSACFTPFDQDVTSSSNESGNNCGLSTAAAPQQSTLPSSPLSSWTCSDELLFPTKLFFMLTDAHEKGFEHIVSWGHGPSSFNVHQKKTFEEQVLPKYFKMTKYKSFTRQLHNYEFQWIRGGPDKGGYCHRYFSRDGTNVDQLLSRKAIALAQTGSDKAPQESSPLASEGVRRWSAPEVLGGFSQPSSEDGQPKPFGTEVLLPLHSSLSCASLLEPQQHRVELKRSESEPMNFSTHSGYLLPPIAAPSWRHKSSGSPSLSQQERSMAYSNSGAGNLYSVNQQDASLNPFLTVSKNNLGMLSDSQDSFFAGMSTGVMPTTTLRGSRGLTVGDLSTTSSMGDLPHPHHVPLNISGVPNRQSSAQHPPLPGFPISRFLAGPGSSSAPLCSSPSLPATMMMDRDDVLVNLHQSSSMRMSSPPLGGDAASNDPNPLEKFPTFLRFGTEEAEEPTSSLSIPQSHDGMYDNDTAAAAMTIEPRTIEEMMQDESDRSFR